MLKKTLIATFLSILLLQFIPLEKTNPKVNDAVALNTDVKVMEILKKSCYDCHSDETKWSIYSDIAPLSFGVVSHVNDGRLALNFSKYDEIALERKEARLRRAITTVKNDRMPLPSYLTFHDEALMSKAEKIVLIKWFEKELVKITN